MEILELGRKPVSDSSPAGADARYEPEYDQLQLEIDKLSSATAGGVVDWKRVVKLGSMILLNKSKDLKVASYLGVGLMHLKGVEGLSAGAQILLDMVNSFWDDLYPTKKRMRGRFGAVSWWAENAGKFFKDYQGDELPRPVVDLLAKRINELDSALSGKSEDAPMLRDLAGYAQRLPVKAEQAPPETEPESTAAPAVPDASEKAGSTAPAATPAATVSAGDISSPEECAGGLRTGLSVLEPVADYLLANDLADSTGYRLRRLVFWMPVTVLPPAENGRTMIPTPEEPVLESISSQLQNNDFAGALRAAESRIGQFLFWLDLSRLSAEALKGLGDQYSDALDALEHEVELYVKRLPGIAGLSFADGTPFADPRTRSWLQSLGRGKGAESGPGGEDDSFVTRVMADAGKLAAAKKLVEAVTVLNDGCMTAPSERERFQLRKELTVMLTVEGQIGLAHVHSAGLLQHIENFGLEKWEPELALSGLLAAYEALVAEGGQDSAEKATDVLKRIGRLCPAAALKINGFN